MSDRSSPGSAKDSLDLVELTMAIEEAIGSDANLTPAERDRWITVIEEVVDRYADMAPAQREQLIAELRARIERGEFGHLDEFGDNGLGILVKKPGPKSPRGQAGAAADSEFTD